MHNGSTTEKQHYLFVDESGIADFLDESYKYFLLTSVAVDTQTFAEIDGYFSLIKRKYELEKDKPFHTYDLLENPESDILLSPREAREFVRSMCEFIDLVPLQITALHLNKPQIKKWLSISTEDLKGSAENKKRRGAPYLTNALRHLERFTDLIESEDSSGYILVDSRMHQDREMLEAFIEIQQQTQKGAKTNPYFNTARQRLNAITFADKNFGASGIQLADFISFVVYHHLNRRMASFKEICLQKSWNAIREKAHIADLVTDMGKQRFKRYMRK